MLDLNNAHIDKLYVGDKEVQEIYLGETLVYSNEYLYTDKEHVFLDSSNLSTFNVYSNRSWDFE